MFTRKPRLRLGKIVINSAKGLLQHNRHKADVRGALANVCFRGKSRHRNEGGLT